MRRKIAVKENLRGCGRTRPETRTVPRSRFLRLGILLGSIASVLEAESSGRRSFSESCPRNAREGIRRAASRLFGILGTIEVTWVTKWFLAVCLCIGLSGSCMADDRPHPPEDAGQAALARGDYRAAETFYRQALLEHPASPEALTALGVSVKMQGRSGEAIHLFQRALELKSLPLTYALLAEEKCETRDLDGARPMMAQILRKEAQDVKILAVVAPCYLDLGQPVESVQVYSTILSSGVLPEDLILVQLAKSYLRGAQLFFSRLSAAPGNSAYIRAIQQARDTGSSNARGAFDEAARSSTYFRSGLSFPEAVSVWKQHPADAALLYLLSVLSGEESMRQVETCYARYPDSPYLKQLAADMLADHGHEDEAVEAYLKLIQVHPEMPGLHYSLGMLYRKRGQWDKALEVFQEQLAHDSKNEQTAARVSEALLALNRWAELRTFLEPRVNTGDRPLWAVLDLAQATQKLGNNERAIQLLAAAEKDNMSSKTLHYRLMLLYKLTNHAAQAEKERQFFEQQPQDRQLLSAGSK
jgi:tetratricopeptide (TPR) repeat protein